MSKNVVEIFSIGYRRTLLFVTQLVFCRLRWESQRLYFWQFI